MNTSVHPGLHIANFQDKMLIATNMDTISNTKTNVLTPPTEKHSLCRHTNHQWRDARGMQRQHGPWVPTVISHRMAAVTE